MEKVSIISGTESKEIEEETNKKFFELKEKGCQILDVIGSMICYFTWCVLYVLCINLLKNGINRYVV